jgi:integrase
MGLFEMGEHKTTSKKWQGRCCKGSRILWRRRRVFYIYLSGSLASTLWLDKISRKFWRVDNNDRWVMRDLWDIEVPQGRGLAKRPKKLASLGIKRLMERAIWAQGLRKKLENGKKRHLFSANHSYRKWFKTRCEQAGMKPINIETLLSHSVGISDHYYRPTENDLLEEYLKAVDFLAMNEENRLKLQIQELTEKT